jgi:hypothetical protein
MKKILKKLLIIAAVLMIPVLLYGGYNQENVGGGIVGPYNANDCEKVNAQGQTVSAGGACGTSAAVYPGGNGIMTVSGGNSYGSVLPYTAFGASIFDAANASAALADLGAAASNAIRGDSIGSNTNELLRVDGSNNVAPVTLDSNLILSSGGNLTLNVGTGANQIVQLNSSDKLPAVDGSLLTNFTAAQVAAFSWVQGGLAPVSGNVMIKGTGANISPSGWSLVGTNGGAYDLDLIGTGGNLTLNVGTGANQIVQLNSSDKLPAVDGSLLTNFTAAQVAAFSWVQGGLAPVSGKPLLQGTGANASVANITLSGTANTTYNLDTMGGGNITVSMAIGGNVSGGTPGYLLTVGTNSVLAQDPLGSNVLAALGIAANASGGFQGTLISGTNIKTVSGHALLGSGDVALNVNDVANSLAFSGSPTTGHLAQIGAANTIVDGGTGSNLSVAYAVNAGTAAAANSVAGGNVSGNVAGANAVGVNGITGLGTGVANALQVATNTIGAFVVNIASGVANIPTSVIGTNTTVTLTAANASIVAGDVCDWGIGGHYTGNGGFIPGSQLSIYSYSGAGNCDWDITNNTGANITPAANMTITWKVRR